MQGALYALRQPVAALLLDGSRTRCTGVQLPGGQVPYPAPGLPLAACGRPLHSALAWAQSACWAARLVTAVASESRVLSRVCLAGGLLLIPGCSAQHAATVLLRRCT